MDGNYSAAAVIKMVNVLMKNTQKKGGDQFGDDSTKALHTFIYLMKYNFAFIAYRIGATEKISEVNTFY